MSISVFYKGLSGDDASIRLHLVKDMKEVEEQTMQLSGEKGVLVRWKNNCRGPEVRGFLLYLRHKEETCISLFLGTKWRDCYEMEEREGGLWGRLNRTFRPL